MEKLIYILVGEIDTIDSRIGHLAKTALPAARALGASNITMMVPDEKNQIAEKNPGRIMGQFDNIAAVFECWLPNVDTRQSLEQALARHCKALWGYLVTESTIAPCPHTVSDGERVPGITQLGMNDKPQSVKLGDFYQEWAVHSDMSFDLHPTRTSYTRNAVARPLTTNAPTYMGIVWERFPALEHFVDDSIYFGSPQVVTEMIEHLPKFYDFSTAISGGMSEYRWQ